MGKVVGGLTGGKSGSSSSTRELSPQALELYNSYVKPYAEKASKYATGALDFSDKLLNDNNYGTQNVDYGAYDSQAQGQIANAQNIAMNLANGILPQAYQANMQDAIQSGVNNTLGSTLNTLADRGVLGGSVMNKANADMANSVANTMAQQYQQNVGTLSNLANQQASLANAPITTSSMAQQAALSPVQSLANLSTGVQGAGVSQPFSALVGGTGSQSQSSSQSSGKDTLQTAMMLAQFFV